MKTHLLKNLLILMTTIGFSYPLTAQIADYNTDAFGFELTSVDYAGGTSDVVTAFTQVAGFYQTSAKAKTGTKSMAIDVDFDNLPGTLPKLQTWRANVNKEGSFTINYPVANPATQEYLVSAWVFIDGSDPGNLNLSPKNMNVNIDLTGVETGSWQYIYKVVSDDAAIDLGVQKQWFTVSLVSSPTVGDGTTATDCVLYIDDLKIEQYDGVQTYTFSEYHGAESADAVVEGVIDPTLNGNTADTGWWLGSSSNNYEFSSEQKASGQYSLKFDSDGAQGASTSYSASIGIDSSPAASRLTLADGNYTVSLKVFIDANAPSKIQTNIGDNAASGGDTTPFNAITWFLDTNGDGTGSALATDVWHTLTQVVEITSTTEAKVVYKLVHLDIPSAVEAVVPASASVLYFDDLTFTFESALGVNDLVNDANSISLYPNPASDNVTISAPVGSEISITNLTGTTVKQNIASAAQTTISVADLASGIYIVNVASEGKSFVTKLVVR